jgi:excisionase family DNA binding protein
VTSPLRPSTSPHAVSLDALARDPELVASLSRAVAAAALIELAELRVALTARVSAPDEQHAQPLTGSRLLSATEAASRLGMSVRWLYAAARAGKLPFARRLSAGAVRFDESGLERWLEKRA